MFNKILGFYLLVNCMMLKTFLIVGGLSGLGLELAKKYLALGHTVHITGQHDPDIEGLQFKLLNYQVDHLNTSI